MHNILTYHIFSPGGNTTALVSTSVSKSQRLRVSSEIMRNNQVVEQVGFILPPHDAHHDFILEMAGGEFCANAARCAALLHAQKTGKHSVVFQISGLPFDINATVTDNTHVMISFPSQLFLQSVPIPEGQLIDFTGISFMVTKDEKILSNPEKIIAKYDNHKFRAFGIVHIIETGLQKLTINPWIWVRETKTLVNESACGSGSMAACLSVMDLSDQKTVYCVLQPSGSIYTVSIEKRDGRVFSIGMAGEVSYLGEENLYAEPHTEREVTMSSFAG